MGMRNILKLGPIGASFCESDDSGRGPRPHPRSQVEPEDRLWFHTHNTAATFLSGIHLKAILKTFQTNLRTRIEALRIDRRWDEIPDLYQFIYKTLFPTQVEVLFGTSFLALNPNFLQDFRDFHKGLVYLLRGYPSWLVPTACSARERCLGSIKRWHLFLKEQEGNENPPRDEERSRLYGSRYIRTLQKKYGRMKPLDLDAVASSELGVIWAANSNIITATFWYIIELAKDPRLLSRIHAEVGASLSQTNDSRSTIDTDRLCTRPFIQSAYAEVLRLHTYNFLLTTSEHSDFNFRGWKIPKDQMVGISSHTAHMDNKAWNTGLVDGKAPVETFWAERFLIYEGSARSKPLKMEHFKRRNTQRHSTHDLHSFSNSSFASEENYSSEESPRFCLDELSGIWIPFGGGYSLCPGRHVAKAEILLAVALVSTAFEFEVLDQLSLKDRFMSRFVSIKDKGLQHDMRYFGMGVLPPKDKVAARIRRRVERD
ncbi:hypothetical protein EPUS_08931 [Endocarpon pusillum Z07020]|uniref:Cytochrome P450 n=1 Tax=Endocarpon pusillum (strain Z07020 / HMAS-L-300199) TaxID=1263415 RepID=U1GH90_ENDPU|nr:uncharacterized protein EPUS_08931 [Endocarpon pusillum Z07020]ERF71136.1 hypothetical protein EPUS_08931 [Endocarpon pusillum Z07020]